MNGNRRASLRRKLRLSDPQGSLRFMADKIAQRLFGGLADGAEFIEEDGIIPERFFARVYFDSEDTELCGCDADEASLRAPYKLDRALSKVQDCWAYVPDLLDAQ